MSIFTGVRGYSSAAYPWDGNANVVGWVPDPAWLTFNGGDVTSMLSTNSQYAITAPSASAEPTYGATLINSNPGLYFDGVANEMLNTTDSGLYTFADGDDTDCTMIMLAAFLTSVSGSQFVGFFNAGSHRYRYIQASVKHRIDRAGTGPSSSDNVATTLGVYTVRFENTSSPQQQRFYVNQTEDGGFPSTNDRPSITSTQFGLFPGGYGGDYPEANFGGLWLVKNDDTAAIAAIEAWALARAGL